MKAPFVRILRLPRDRRKVLDLVVAIRQFQSRLTALEGLHDFDRRACTAYGFLKIDIDLARKELQKVVKAGAIRIRPQFTRRWFHIYRHKVHIKKCSSNAETLFHLGIALRIALLTLNGCGIPHARCRVISEKLVAHYALMVKRRLI